MSEMSLKDGCGILCAAQLMALSPGIKSVLATTVRDSRVRGLATAVGIRGLCCKPLRFGPFLSTLRSVIWSTSPAGRAAPRGREEEVLRCMEQGMLYTDIQGLNYVPDPATGEWAVSQDLIELMPDGSAAALRGPAKLYAKANLNSPGAITIAQRYTTLTRMFRTSTVPTP